MGQSPWLVSLCLALSIPALSGACRGGDADGDGDGDVDGDGDADGDGDGDVDGSSGSCDELDPVAAFGAPCCPDYGIDACAPGATCALLDGRTVPACFVDGSRSHGESCAGDVLCAPNSPALTCQEGEGGERRCLLPAESRERGESCQDELECSPAGAPCEEGLCGFLGTEQLACELSEDCPEPVGDSLGIPNLEPSCSETTYSAAEACHDVPATLPDGRVCVVGVYEMLPLLQCDQCPTNYPECVRRQSTLYCSPSPLCRL